MSDYTPTTEDVRDSYAADIAHVGTYADKVLGFDRWFASEIEKAEYRGAVKAGRAIVEANLAKSDHEFGEFM